MYFKISVLFAIVAVASAGYLQPALRYEAPAAIGFAAPTPAISYAAPAIARVEHLAPAVASVHKTELYTAPIARTGLVAPAAVHTVGASPLIAAPAAPLLRTGYIGHGVGYAAAPAAFGLAGVAPFGFGGAYRAGW